MRIALVASTTRPIEGVSAAYYHIASSKPSSSLLAAFKYRGIPSIATDLFLLFKDSLEAFLLESDIDGVVPVPMHPIKKWKRGYNQAEVLSSQIAKYFNLSHQPNLLKKTALYRSQVKRNARERTSSNSSIRLNKPGDFEAKHLLLIDDVITTGATLSHCIEALSKIPDIKISVFTIFYTPSRASHNVVTL
jgi:ComF family protein